MALEYDPSPPLNDPSPRREADRETGRERGTDSQNHTVDPEIHAASASGPLDEPPREPAPAAAAARAERRASSPPPASDWTAGDGGGSGGRGSDGGGSGDDDSENGDGGIRWLRWAVPLLIVVLVGAVAGVTVAAAIHMPRVDSLADFTPARITQIYDAEGRSFASYARQRRVVLAQEEIPDLMRQAVIAVEDSNFYQHGGLDAFGVIRALMANLQEGDRVEGASTLTMQLARQLFLSTEKTWHRKIQEALLAVELEKSFSKEQLLTLYLNVCYLGHGQYGVEAASRYYFGKSVDEIELAEAATLAGIYQRPSAFSPRNNARATRERRNHVLGRMLAEDFITREQYEEAVASPIEVVQHAPRDQLGEHMAEEVRRHLAATYGTSVLLEQGLQVETTLDPEIQASAETALREGLVSLDRRGGGYRGAHAKVEEGEPEEVDLESWGTGRFVADGWFEGIVLEANRTAALVRYREEVYRLTPEGMAWTRKGTPDKILARGDVAWFKLTYPDDEAEGEGGEGEGAERDGEAGEPTLNLEPNLTLEQVPRMQGAVVVLESATGAARAMVGGWDFHLNQFNRVTQAQRQVGSAFKLFVYGAALEAGFTPADTIFDAPVYFRGADNRMSYSPKNYYPKYYGITTLARGIEQSFNVTAVKLMDIVSIEETIAYARRAGVESELPPYPSLALGAADISPLEMAGAFAAIANQGTYVKPYWIEAVRTPEGEVLERHLPEPQTVTSPEKAYVLATMLRGVVTRGTARRLANLDIDIAGKTGTTNDYSNAWFAGFTPRYTILVWVGHDTPKSLGRGMAGDKVAVPIWREIAVSGLEKGWIEEGETFTPPAGVTTVMVDYRTGLLAEGRSPRPVPATFVAGTEPARDFSWREYSIAGLPWYQQQGFYIPKEGERMP